MKHLLPSFLTTLLITISLISCNSSIQENKSAHKPKIVCTTGMIADAMKNIFKDSAEVTALMGPGTDPHSYSTKPTDMKLLQEADVIVYNGLHLEGKMSDMLHNLARQKTVIALGDGIPKENLRKIEGEATDPHIWFDTPIWITGIKYSLNKLTEKYPSHKKYLNNNAKQYTTKLNALHLETRSKIATIPKEQRVLVTAHDAFSYFGTAYNIEVKPLKGISTVSETSIKEVNDLIDLILKRKIKAIFVESSVNPKNIEMIAETCRQKGHNITIGGTLFSDAMGAENTPEGTYIGMVQSNVNTIVNALK